MRRCLLARINFCYEKLSNLASAGSAFFDARISAHRRGSDRSRKGSLADLRAICPSDLGLETSVLEKVLM